MKQFSKLCNAAAMLEWLEADRDHRITKSTATRTNTITVTLTVTAVAGTTAGTQRAQEVSSPQHRLSEQKRRRPKSQGQSITQHTFAATDVLVVVTQVAGALVVVV